MFVTSGGVNFSLYSRDASKIELLLFDRADDGNPAHVITLAPVANRGEGEGTLAPWDPTRKLVVRGPYRYVRNPMITGVVLVLLGEAALLGSRGVLAWAGIFFAINGVWFRLVEEAGLVRRFGAEYEQYRRNVPRWVPRRTPWPPES